MKSFLAEKAYRILLQALEEKKGGGMF